MNAQRFARRLRVVQVTEHHRRAGHADLALFAGRKCSVGPGAANHGQHVGKGNADRALAILVERRRHDCGDRLGESVAFEQLHPAAALGDEFFEAFLHRPRQRIGAGEGGAQARQVGLRQRRVARERVVQRRHAHQQVRPLRAQQLRHDFGTEHRNEDRFAARHEGGVHAHAQAEAVENRQNRKDGMALDHAAPGGGLHAFGDEIAVRQQDPLRHAGGSAGEQDRRGIVGGRAAARRRRVRTRHEIGPPAHAPIGGYFGNLASLGEPEAESLCRRKIVGNARQDQRFEWQLRLDRSEAVVECVQRERDARAARVEVVFDFGSSRQRMDERGHGAELVRRVERDHALGRSRHRDEDALACREAECGQRIGAGVDGCKERAVGRGCVEEIPGEGIGHARGRRGHGLVQRDLRVAEAGGHATVKAQPGTGLGHRGLERRVSRRTARSGGHSFFPRCHRTPGARQGIGRRSSQAAPCPRRYRCKWRQLVL